MSAALDRLDEVEARLLTRPGQAGAMKAVLARERFRDPDWIFERKLDGIREWTGSRRLRHPRFLGLGDDKPARSVVSEQ